MPVSATAKSIEISVRKVRPYLQSVKGLPVDTALDLLKAMPSPVAGVVAKVISSARANAENNRLMSPQDLRIVGAFADGGRTLKRVKARARGRATRIKRHSCSITVLVDEELV